MTDETTEADDGALTAAEYALGLLDAPEARAFEGEMDGSPTARADYAFWAEHLVALTDDVDPVSPPEALWTGIAASVAMADTAAAPGRRSWMERLGLLPAMAGGLVAAVAVLWVIGLFVPTEVDQPIYTAELTAEDQSLVVMARYNPERVGLQIRRTIGAAPPGRVLELWLIAGDAAPVSVGLLPEAEYEWIPIAPNLVPLLEGGTLAISEEPPGGSPTGAPTGTVLAAGVVTTL